MSSSERPTTEVEPVKQLEELTSVPEVGCYVDGHWGWRGLVHMVEQFDGVAYVLDDDERALMVAYAQTLGEDVEPMLCLADEAESALRDLLPEGLTALWHDGEFFVSPICDDPDNCADETCAHWC